MKTVIYAETAQQAKRARRPRTGETVAYKSFKDLDGKAPKGFGFEIIGDKVSDETIAKIKKAHAAKLKKDD